MPETPDGGWLLDDSEPEVYSPAIARRATLAGEYDEGKHPRDDHGRGASGGGGPDSAASSGGDATPEARPFTGDEQHENEKDTEP